jgi:pentatricopeptide repeat protein
MAAAAHAKRPKEALRFLQTMPKQHLQRGTFNLAIASCYQAKDMDTCLHMLKLMDKQQMKPDLQHYTTAITGEGGAAAAPLARSDGWMAHGGAWMALWH